MKRDIPADPTTDAILVRTAELDSLRAELAKRDAEIVRLKARRFPIMGGPSIPWSLIAPYEAQAKANHDQTLERLAERGGLATTELWSVVHGKRWNECPFDESATNRWARDWLAAHEGPAAELAGLRFTMSTLECAFATLEDDCDKLRDDRDRLRSIVSAAYQALVGDSEGEPAECIEKLIAENRDLRDRLRVSEEHNDALGDANVAQVENERLLGLLATLRADCIAGYGGGYKDPAEAEIFRHGMTTVCNIVDAALAAAKERSDV